MFPTFNFVKKSLNKKCVWQLCIRFLNSLTFTLKKLNLLLIKTLTQNKSTSTEIFSIRQPLCLTEASQLTDHVKWTHKLSKLFNQQTIYITLRRHTLSYCCFIAANSCLSNQLIYKSLFYEQEEHLNSYLVLF